MTPETTKWKHPETGRFVSDLGGVTWESSGKWAAWLSDDLGPRKLGIRPSAIQAKSLLERWARRKQLEVL